MKSLVLALSLTAAVASAGDNWPQGPWALRDSLRYLPPNLRQYYLRQAKQSPSPGIATNDSVTLRLAGKWGGGPSNKVTGRDSMVYLSRGSQVVVLSFADLSYPRVVSAIELDGVVLRSVLVGSRLYVGSAGIRVYDVSNPASPALLGETRHFAFGDLDAIDSLVYTCANDSFRVFSFADPANPRQVGACRDSGHTLSVSNGYAYVGDRWGLYIMDVRDPTNPHRLASWGTDILSVVARNTICCVTMGELTFQILDVSTPATPVPIGAIDSCGGFDMFLGGPLAFMSGYYTGGHVFRILDISDSTRPRVIGAAGTPAEQHWGVWANLAANRAFIADGVCGLSVLDITNLTQPVIDTLRILAAGHALDVSIVGDLAFVAGELFGMTILDVSSPDQPVELGHVDSTRDMAGHTVAARDSFAYMDWVTHPWLRSIDVSAPTNPLKAGACDLFNAPEDMVLRDSFLYVAEAYRFQVVNIARPRQPMLVGSCALGSRSYGVCVCDSLAYVSTYPLAIVDVSSPTQPAIIGSIPRGSWSVFVKDTLAFVAGGDVFLYDVAEPQMPVLVDSFGANFYISAIIVVDTFAYLGCDDGVRVASVADPLNPRVLALAPAPNVVWRLAYAEPYIYAVCTDAGIALYETTLTGVAEQVDTADRGSEPRLRPNPARTTATLIPGRPGRPRAVTVFDVNGRVTPRAGVRMLPDGSAILELAQLPAGVFCVEVLSTAGREVLKLVKH